MRQCILAADNELDFDQRNMRRQSTCQAGQSDKEALNKVVTKVIIRLIVKVVTKVIIRLIVKVVTKVILIIWRHLWDFEVEVNPDIIVLLDFNKHLCESASLE